MGSFVNKVLCWFGRVAPFGWCSIWPPPPSSKRSRWPRELPLGNWILSTGLTAGTTPHALSSRWTQTRFDFFSDQRFWSSKFDNLRHLVFQSIFLPVESGVVRHSNTQIHLDKVNEFKIDTKSTVTLLSLFDEMSHQEQWATSLPNSQPSSLMSFYRQNKPESFALCVYLGSLNTVHVCVTPTMPIARQCKALCTKQADHANCKLHSAHPTPVNCGQLTKTASSLARVIIASESA